MTDTNAGNPPDGVQPQTKLEFLMNKVLELHHKMDITMREWANNVIGDKLFAIELQDNLEMLRRIAQGAVDEEIEERGGTIPERDL